MYDCRWMMGSNELASSFLGASLAGYNSPSDQTSSWEIFLRGDTWKGVAALRYNPQELNRTHGDNVASFDYYRYSVGGQRRCALYDRDALLWARRNC